MKRLFPLVFGFVCCGLAIAGYLDGRIVLPGRPFQPIEYAEGPALLWAVLGWLCIGLIGFSWLLPAQRRTLDTKDLARRLLKDERPVPDALKDHLELVRGNVFLSPRALGTFGSLALAFVFFMVSIFA
ncbi:MAG: hypothetical protein U5S82_02845 [Gammaproteobacteria bacterium]|nr:hypothetical protein [Gammaproteobacteria bacterium]